MSNTNYPNLNPQLQNAKGAAINAKDAVVNSKVRGQVIPARALSASALQEEVLCATRQSIAATFFSELQLTLFPDASAAYQNLANGPAAEKARIESQKTSQEYSNLMDSKRVPDQPAATGQPLTHYHSFFYNLLSWENPRVTTISFASIVTFIFFTRYVPILKYLFKALYIILGITAAAEVVGKLVMDRGFASRMRPRKYYTIPRESLEASLDDVEQLINFFVIEFQRIMFGENVFVTVGAFFITFISYFLVKIMPTWGLALLFTTLIYTVPLVYINNREVIDAQIDNASNIINEQTQQVRTIAAEQTQYATDIAKSTATDLQNRASELIGQAKQRAGQADAPNPANLNPAKDEPEREIKKEDVQNAANDLTNKAAATAQDAANKTSATAQNAADKTSATAQDAANKTSNATGNSFGSSTASESVDRSTEPLTELNAPSVPTTEPSLAAHTQPVLPDENAYHENAAPEKVRAEAPLL
ncbi:hypothetical protein QM012_003460 [Aureobasidium pullulans]|uniref:Reticulon-like protein n=1 Tax=Aureobasidium pullulans TaxID=5580 RepID=A0ABR0T8H1_AURPU